MHIWPSSSIRNSFKSSYLSKLEWNLQRMKREKQQQKQRQSSINQNLLDNKNESESQNADASDLEPHGGLLRFCRDLAMILSCCYCCFCCGVGSSSPAKTMSSADDSSLRRCNSSCDN